MTESFTIKKLKYDYGGLLVTHTDRFAEMIPLFLEKMAQNRDIFKVVFVDDESTTHHYLISYRPLKNTILLCIQELKDGTDVSYISYDLKQDRFPKGALLIEPDMVAETLENCKRLYKLGFMNKSR